MAITVFIIRAALIWTVFTLFFNKESSVPKGCASFFLISICTVFDFLIYFGLLMVHNPSPQEIMFRNLYLLWPVIGIVLGLIYRKIRSSRNSNK